MLCVRPFDRRARGAPGRGEILLYHFPAHTALFSDFLDANALEINGKKCYTDVLRQSGDGLSHVTPTFRFHVVVVRRRGNWASPHARAVRAPESPLSSGRGRRFGCSSLRTAIRACWDDASRVVPRAAPPRRSRSPRRGPSHNTNATRRREHSSTGNRKWPLRPRSTAKMLTDSLQLPGCTRIPRSWLHSPSGSRESLPPTKRGGSMVARRVGCRCA